MLALWNRKKKAKQEVPVIQEKRPLTILDNIPKPDDITFLTSAVDISNPDYIKFGGNRFTRQYYLAQWPKKVNFDALRRIYNFPADIDVSVHMVPIDSAEITRTITAELTRLEATYIKEKKRGNITYTGRLERTIPSLYDLRDVIESGDEKMYYVSLLVSINAETEADLHTICKKFVRRMDGHGFAFQDAYKRQDEAFFSVMPLGADRIGAVQNLESSVVAELFPFTSSKFSHTTGIPFGRDMASGNPLYFNPFLANDQMFNPNIIVFAYSGAGKSALIKLMLARALALRIHGVILDPEREYKKLVDALGGVYIDLSLYSKHRINPFDVEAVTETDDETGETTTSVQLLGKIADLIKLTKFMCSIRGYKDVDAVDTDSIEEALKKTYAKFTITDDPESLYEEDVFEDGRLKLRQKKTMPIFSDFYEQLEEISDASRNLLAALKAYKRDGSMGMFDYHSTVDLSNSHITAFNLKPLETQGDLRPLAMNVILTWIKDRFIKVDTPYFKMVVMDEAQEFLKHPDTADFCEISYRQIRKWGGSAIAISQSYQTFEKNDKGQAMIQNAGTSFLLRQQKSDVPYLTARYELTEGERDFLMKCKKGQFLLKTSTETAFVQTEPSAIEKKFCFKEKKEVV